MGLHVVFLSGLNGSGMGGLVSGWEGMGWNGWNGGKRAEGRGDEGGYPGFGPQNMVRYGMR